MRLGSGKRAAALVGLVLAIAPESQATPIDTTLARQYFQEFQSICAQDNGNIWGISLYGPMLIADPETHSVIANQCDADGTLEPYGEVFVGKLPSRLGIANTARFWSGQKWTMVMWPLYEDKYERGRLMIHESFHRIQEEIGFPLFSSSSDHLDSYEGRIWLQLEWRALIKALSNRGDKRRKGIEDALIFRTHRRSQFSDADSLESRLEMNEGLAEYTGIKLCGIPESELTSCAVKRFDQAGQWQTFVRSFPYLSGPAYGLLLDEAGARWREDLKPTDDLGRLVERAYMIEMPRDVRSEAEARSVGYDVETLRESELERKEKLQMLIAGYEERFVEGPVLIVPIAKEREGFDISFKPTNLYPLGEHGTVYGTMRVASSWGVLTVTEGALLTPDWDRVYVPAPVDRNTRPLRGEGWELALTENWTLVPAEREGDFALERSE